MVFNFLYGRDSSIKSDWNAKIKESVLFLKNLIEKESIEWVIDNLYLKLKSI